MKQIFTIIMGNYNFIDFGIRIIDWLCWPLLLLLQQLPHTTKRLSSQISAVVWIGFFWRWFWCLTARPGLRDVGYFGRLTPLGFDIIACTFNFHCLFVSVQSLHVDMVLLKFWGFFNFFVKLIFTIDLQMNELIGICQAIHSLVESVFILLADIIQIAVLIWLCIQTVNYPDVSTDIEVIRLLFAYFFQIVAPILDLGLVILIDIILTLNSFQYFPDNLRLPLCPTRVILGDVDQLFDGVLWEWLVGIFTVADGLFIDYDRWFAKYVHILFELVFKTIE